MTNSYEELARRVVRLERRLSNSTPQLTHSTIEGGALPVRAEGGQLTAIIGQQYDGTYGAFTVAGPTPPTPDGPIVESTVPGATVTIPGTWEPLPPPMPGMAATPQVAPMDFLLYEVHAAPTPDFSALLFSTLKGEVKNARGGDCNVALPPDTDYWFRVVARTQSGRASAPSAVVGPVRARKIVQNELDIDFTQFGGANLFYGPTDPREDPQASVGTGDLWYAEVGATDGGTRLYESRRWDGDTWEPLADQSASQALASAIGAAALAGSKTRWVTAAVAPTPTAAEDAEPDLLWWTDTANDNVIKSWRSPDWHEQRLGNGAIQPGSLVLSELAVTGSVTASLLEALMILTNMQVIGNPLGNRITISGVEDETFGIQQVVDGRVTFQLSPDGSTFFAGVLSGRSNNYSEASTGWMIDAEGDAAFQSLQVFDSLTTNSLSVSSLSVGGTPLADLLAQARPRLAGRGENDTIKLSGVTSETGVAELGFTAYPGEEYEINVNGPEYLTTTTGTRVGFYMRATLDGSAPSVNSLLIKNFGQYPGDPATARMFEPMPFLWNPGVTTPTTCRILLTVFKTGSSTDDGTISVSAEGTIRRIQMYARPAGQGLPNSLRVNHSTAVAPPPPPPPPVQYYSDIYFSTWTASYQENGNKRISGGDMYQGYYENFNGSQGSMIGFDLTTIRNRLAGATIKWATLHILNRHTYNGTGATILIGTHGANGEATNWNLAPAMNPRRRAANISKGGWLEMDVTDMVTDIRNNQQSGFTIGYPPPTDLYNKGYYGYWFGQNAGIDRPHFKVGYDK